MGIHVRENNEPREEQGLEVDQRAPSKSSVTHAHVHVHAHVA